MAQLNSLTKAVNKEENKLIKAATKYIDPNSTKAAVIVLGGLSIGTLLYKIYNALPSPHPSIPSAPGFHPILGHAHIFRDNYSNLHDAVFKVVSEYDIVALKMPDFYQIYLNTPKLIEWVFTTEFNKFFKGYSQMEKFECLFGKYGEGIFVSDDSHWRFHRKIGSRMFSVRNLRDYMYNCCMKTTSSTLNVLEHLRITNGEIDINDILGRMTFDCFTSIAFGTSFDSMSLYPKKHPFGESFDVLVRELPKRNQEPLWKIKRWLNIDFEYEIQNHLKVIDKFTEDLITKRKKESIQNITDESGVNTFDLFTLYMNHKDTLTNREIKYIALNFIIAGRDTTRMLTSWFLYDLIMFPQVQKKVIDEIDMYNKENKNGINYNVISKQFKYLEASLCESLRYHPVVPFSTREARDDVIIPHNIIKPENGGHYVIKKGDRCVIHHFTIAKLDLFYKDPMKYNPMRFYEKGVRTFKQGVYPFFNQNPRLCLGRDFALMEAKIFVYHLLTKYSFEMVPNQVITYNPGIIFNMKNGLKISLKPR
eukprot:440511_1